MYLFNCIHNIFISYPNDKSANLNDRSTNLQKSETRLGCLKTRILGGKFENLISFSGIYVIYQFFQKKEKKLTLQLGLNSSKKAHTSRPKSQPI